jgi:methyltransferase
MGADGLFALLLAVIVLERLAELVVSARHVTAAKKAGAVERGFGHYPAMVGLHVGLLVGAATEVYALDRPFLPWLGWSMLGLVVAANALRWWCIRTLGAQWSTRVLVLPGAPLVSSGPYQRFRHPNYVAVVVEGLALPLVHTAWLTALIFTAANAVLLRIRIRCEEAALEELAGAA